MPNHTKSISDEHVRTEVRRLLSEFGARTVASLVGLHPQTMLAIAAGVPVRSGSIAIVREYLRNAKQVA